METHVLYDCDLCDRCQLNTFFFPFIFLGAARSAWGISHTSPWEGGGALACALFTAHPKLPQTPPPLTTSGSPQEFDNQDT